MINSLLEKIPRRWLRFLCVGTLGFVVDAVVLMLLILGFGWGPYSARFISFGVAVPVTWLLNRTWTFRENATSNLMREGTVYLFMQIVGAALNLGIYSAGVYLSSTMREYPLVALALGCGSAMLFNYWAMKRFAFTANQQQADVV